MKIISGTEKEKLKQIKECTGNEIITREELLKQHEELRKTLPAMIKEMHDLEIKLFGEVVHWTDMFPIHPALHCLRCGHSWEAESAKLPKTCPNPKCRSPYWNKPRQVKGSDTV